MTVTLAAITRDAVARYVGTLITVYTILIIIRIVISWIPRMPYNRALDVFLTFVRDVTDPYLNLFRRFVPMLKVGAGALDLSPVVALLVLGFVGRLAVGLIAG
ncbi:MAG: YggT family protein [Thermoleophilaceae bacterium]